METIELTENFKWETLPYFSPLFKICVFNLYKLKFVKIRVFLTVLNPYIVIVPHYAVQ